MANPSGHTKDGEEETIVAEYHEQRGEGSTDINTASREDLIALTGIGEEIADAIIAARPFTAIDDLISLPGIGEATLELLREQGLTLGLIQRGEEAALPEQYRVTLEVTDVEGRQSFFNVRSVIRGDTDVFGLGLPPTTVFALALCICRIFSSTSTTTTARYGAVVAVDVPGCDK